MKVIDDFDIHCGRDIEQAIYKLDTEFYVPVKVYREDHIFDEDKSVRWNREEVVRKNQEQKDLRAIAAELRAESSQHFLKELYRYIMNEAVYGHYFTEAEASVIWKEAERHHDSEPWNWVDDMAESMLAFRSVEDFVE